MELNHVHYSHYEVRLWASFFDNVRGKKYNKDNISYTSIIPTERIINKIYLIRGKKVMFDFDLAELYEVEVKHLKRQVKRNIKRFPDDFFILNQDEMKNWRSHFVTSKKHELGFKIKH